MVDPRPRPHPHRPGRAGADLPGAALAVPGPGGADDRGRGPRRRQLAAGRRPHGQGPFLVFEERTEPGAAWGSAGIASLELADWLASYVIEAGVLGGQHYVAAWATPEVGKVTVRATPASAVQTLPFHAVPGSSLRIAGAWLADFRPGSSTVTFYDRAGAVITAYPKGPCRQFR